MSNQIARLAILRPEELEDFEDYDAEREFRKDCDRRRRNRFKSYTEREWLDDGDKRFGPI